MANTTFANLKIGALRRLNWYNSADATLLQTTGGLINDCLSDLYFEAPDSMYWRDLDNTVSTVASQAYVDLTDTNIMEILNVFQRETDTKLVRVDRQKHVELNPDESSFTGTPDLFYDVEQILSGAGVNTFRIYIIPPAASVITLRYDYLKNSRFSADGTTADAEYSPLPTQFDTTIYEMAKPRILELVAPGEVGAINNAKNTANAALTRAVRALRSAPSLILQSGSMRARKQVRSFNVADTPTP